MRIRHWILVGLSVAVLSSAIVGCGGRSSSSSTAVIPGDREALVLDVVRPTNRIQGIAAADIGTYGDGARVALTEIELAFVPSATVGAMNDLLESIGASIVYAQPKLAILLLRIPNAGSVDVLDALETRLQTDPLVRFVRKGYFPGKDDLPPNVTPEDTTYIAHHVAVRAPAAWAMRSLMDPVERPTLVVADHFGDGPLGPDFSVVLTPDSALGSGARDDHGHHVLGIAAASFGGSEIARGQITGIYPTELRVSIIDLARELVPAPSAEMTMPAIEYAILARVGAALPGRAVLNTSLGFGCNTAELVERLCNETHATSAGLAWAEKVRALDLEDRMIHVTSAGNVEGLANPAAPQANTDARYNSSFTAARLLIGTLPEPVKPLRNTLVIENVIAAGVPPTPRCLSAGSKIGGDLAAIGTDVWSLVGALNGLDQSSGTSMAAPQVAGLAAYLWALNPPASNTEIIEQLRASARPISVDTATDARCAAAAPAPLIDAFAAVLASDDALDAGARVRLKLLDVTGPAGDPDGRFDDKDVDVFVQVFDALPGSLDYSIHDLNGDGRTGGSGVERFDLDANRSIGQVTQRIGEDDVAFDEAGVSDVEVLCYYAYSPLFAGDDEQRARRDELLQGRCGVIPIEPRRTFLHVCSLDDAWDAVPLRLADLNIQPGDRIRIESLGYFDPGGGYESEVGHLGLFSSSDTLLDKDQRYRVPGAIDAGVDYFTGDTWECDQEPTDIPQDFGINPIVDIVVPDGATHLFIIAPDVKYEDNVNDGNYRVKLQKLPAGE